MLTMELDERIAILEMRKHAGWYIKGMKNCTDIKSLVNTEKSIEGVYKILDNYKKILN